jgi:hypothetical protein
MTKTPISQNYNLIPIWWYTPALSLASSPGPYIDRAKVTIVEVKDLRQTVVIETGYEKTNSWLELDQKFCSWLEQIKNSVIRTNVTLV